MKFSILSWNVEAFKGSEAQLTRVAAHIRNVDPDVFGLFEVENINIIALIGKHLPAYDYSLTDGPENKEILVGVRRGKFQQSIFSQKREFKAFNPALRPGALMSVSYEGEFYNILYLHTDSGTEAASFGNRSEMFGKIWSLRRALQKQATGGATKFIALGDLNTMGLQYPVPKKANTKISEADEITAVETFGKVESMVLLRKEFGKTFNNGRLTSDLDHILATDNVKFRELGVVDGQPFYVRVTGWQQLNGSARKEFIETVSDHCSLYCEVL